MPMIHPKKLLGSKWTAVEPIDKARHFLVLAVARDGNGRATDVTLEAVLTRSHYAIPWRDLNDEARWLAGWR